MKVLIAPLDWGLGHATRCVPVIREYLRQGAQVELAVVKANASFFRSIFPNLRQRLAPSYNIVYPKHGYNMGLWLLKNGAHLNRVIRFEREFAEEMVERYHYDVLVSDNRFGFHCGKAKSIYMTHQRRIAFPSILSAFESVGILWHNSVMRHFDEVWVPDLEETPGYAGTLSHVGFCPRPVKYVGLLSRFMSPSMESQHENSVNVFTANMPAGPHRFVAVVSGVEPARGRFEKILMEIFSQIPGRHAMIQGRTDAGVKFWTEGNVDCFTHLPDDHFTKVVQSAQWVVSRGGYSTIMDMAFLGAKCVFVPTPGQYEQVVLARELSKSKYAINLAEENLSKDALLEATKNTDFQIPQAQNNDLLRTAVVQSFRKKKV